MTFKNGFFIGGAIGFLAYLTTLGAFDIQNITNFSGYSKLIVFLVGLAALVLTPIVIWHPKTLDTIWKGFLVGFPWGIAIVTLTFQIIANILDSIAKMES